MTGSMTLTMAGREATLPVPPTGSPLAPAPLPALLPKLWRDPHTVPAEELKAVIVRLEEACQAYPESADLRTCLGMAHAMNYEAYKSMDALEEARRLEPGNFWAQFKFAELMYRLRALPRSEEETLRALELAQDGWQASMARKQLQEIRRLIREGTQKPTWTKSLKGPSFVLAALFVAGSIAMSWLR